MKEKDALISYVELSIKECDKFAEKWHRKGLDNVAIKFEGMAEAYNDILKKLIGEND